MVHAQSLAHLDWHSGRSTHYDRRSNPAMADVDRTGLRRIERLEAVQHRLPILTQCESQPCENPTAT